MHSMQLEAFTRLGFDLYFERQFQILCATNELPPGAFVARVLAVARGQFLVSAGEGQRAVLAGRLQHLGVRACVGDFVLLEGTLASDALLRIVHVFERRSIFQRTAPGGTSQPQLIAANVDVAVVVCALAADDTGPHARSRGLSARRIERYLRAIRDAPARALVVLNKSDLSPNAEAQAAQLRRELCGVPVILASAEQAAGVEELERELAPGTTAVLVGSSGVGKSSLTNRLLGRAAQEVNAVREQDTRGRHTTTGREVFVLPTGALLIDTPGMREFALFADDETDREETGFPEIDELSPRCRFRDCRHQSEPGWAVLAAVAEGKVSGERLEQAHKFERELTWQRGRHDPKKQSEQRAVWKARTRSTRAVMKGK